ncbi:Uncharacterised protein [uncultured archaeon]|nr:Uncharacterised protein [uncultured archaeon]
MIFSQKYELNINMVVMGYKKMKPQMNADERGFIITLSENLLLFYFCVTPNNPYALEVSVKL